jgi:DNA-binding phage protein
MEYIEDKYFIAIANYVKAFIDEGIDIADLADAANVDRKQIYRLINKENIPKLSTLVKNITSCRTRTFNTFLNSLISKHI